VNFQRDVRQAFLGGDSDYCAEVAGPETPHMQIKQLIAGGLDRAAHLFLDRIGGRASAPVPWWTMQPAGSVPVVGILRETGTLYPYDAKPLTSRRLHHHPAFEAVHHLSAQ
jgi:hypothetical protein